MKTNHRPLWILFAFVMGILTPVAPVIFAADPYAPTLKITPELVPKVSVQGVSGAKYELQFTPSLITSNWQALTNFVLGGVPFTLVDPAARAAGIRMYRALLLATNGSSSYAPLVLSPAEIFHFTSQSAGLTNLDMLVLNSPTNGVLVRMGSMPDAGLTVVSIAYTRLGAQLAQIAVVKTPTPALPMGSTNLYTLVFTGSGTGYFQSSDGVITSTVGEFVRDQSLLGRQLAPAQPTPGEIYDLASTNFFSVTNSLVINSTSTAMWLSSSSLPPGGGAISAASIVYQFLGPLSCQFQVIVPDSSGIGQPQTNFYSLIYSTTNGGLLQTTSPMAISALGVFSVNRSLVGRTLAQAQLIPGEIYSLTTTNVGITTTNTLVINTVNSAMLVATDVAPASSLNPVSITYSVLGPLAGQVQVVISPSNGIGFTQTNLYSLVYTSTNAGMLGVTAAPVINSFGTFSVNRSLTGQQIASAPLAAGEVYKMLSTSFGIPNLTTLAIDSPTNGTLVLPNTPPLPSGFINAASLDYLVLGPLSCQLQAIIPQGGGNPVPQTNLYYLVYTTTNAGLLQHLGAPTSDPVGTFVREKELIGQTVASTALAGGEIYNIVLTSAGIPTSYTLALNSPGSGRLITSGNSPASGVASVLVSYQLLSPVSCQMQVIIPPGNSFPTPQTNFYSLIYSGANSGALQSSNGLGYSLGTFSRDRALVGQQPAPAQLAPGESYALSFSNSLPPVLEAIVLNSPTNGTMVNESLSPDGGLFLNSGFNYARLDNWSGQIQAILPPTPQIPASRTNTYLFIYLASNSGMVQKSSDPAIIQTGLFQRTPAP